MEVLDMNSDYDLMRICRSCRRDDQVLHPIFESPGLVGVHPNGGGGATLHEMLTSCTQLQINYNDGMPPNVCSVCLADINAAYSFRKRSEQSDVLLREYLSRKKLEVGVGGPEGVKVELFDIKPDITFIDGDPLIGEKCFVATLATTKLDQPQEEQNDDGLIEVLEDEDGQTGYVVDSDVEEDVSDDDDGDEEYLDEGSLDELIEEVKSKAGRFKGFSRIKGGKFACDTCERVFPDKRGIANHVKQHEPKQVKECTLCDRTFSTKYHLTRHMKIHEDANIQCDQCEKQIASYNEYREHMALEHPGVPIQAQRKDGKPDLTFTLTVEMLEERGKMEATCRICDATFDRIAELRNHLKTHVDPKTFADINIQTKPYLFEEGYVLDSYQDFIVQQVLKWDVHRFCQIVQPDGEELELSDSDSDPEQETQQPPEGIIRRDHVCALCNQSFPRIKTIIEHAKATHRPEDLIGCRHCSRGFPNNALLMRHLRQQCENHSKKFFCSFCNEKFAWQTSLNKHAQSKHKPTRPLFEKPDPPEAEEKGNKKFVCQICQKGFLRLEHLDRHVKIHIPSEKKFECTQCHKKFNRKDNLRSHMKIHKKDTEQELAAGGGGSDKQQNQLCVYCGRGFSNSSNLIVHMRRHTGERPYKCDICDKGFPRSSDLQCHRRTHTGEKPCLCTICGKGFSRSNKLVRHMRIHTGARPYSCTYCDRAFTQSNDLTLHIRRHTGEKPYVCGICNERFIQGTALKAHQRVTGHFDDGSGQPERFASISVNNPNRLGINGPKAVRQGGKSSAATTSATGTEDGIPKAVKPVKSRKKGSGSRSAAATSAPPVSIASAETGPEAVPPSNVLSAPASPPGDSNSSSRPTVGLQNLGGTAAPSAHGYVSVPYLLPNYDLASTGLFSQNYSQQ